jgi:hypothetical protein
VRAVFAQVRGDLAAGRGVAAADHDLGALGGRGPGHARAKPLSAPADQHNLRIEQAHA